MERAQGISETVPEEESQKKDRNKHRSPAMLRGGLYGGLAAIIIGGLSIACEGKPIAPRGDAPSVAELLADINNTPISGEIVKPTDSELAILEALNVQREDQGLLRLSLDTKLVILARARSQHMINNGYFSHLDKTGDAYYDDLIDAICTPRTMKGWRGENIAANNLSESEETVEEWIKHPKQRRVLLNPHFKSVGIGEAEDYQGVRYVTALYSENPC